MDHSGWLFDANCIIALLDPIHLHHEPIHDWFSRRSPRAFGMCPLTENGAARVLSQSVYRSGRREPAQSIAALQEFKSNNAESYRFVPNSISLTDSSIFLSENPVGSKLVTDLYLAGLAFVNGWKLVTFDRRVPWHAVKGADASLIEIPHIA
jgi:predicted nucleic acid-binding protein